MIADYMDSLTTYGAAFYRNLFWEAGMVGQVLYLEAEEAGIRSTGIGCYFDDPVHEVFGIASREWQSFYHFTVGGPVEDARLTTLPAYGHAIPNAKENLVSAGRRPPRGCLTKAQSCSDRTETGERRSGLSWSLRASAPAAGRSISTDQPLAWAGISACGLR